MKHRLEIFLMLSGLALATSARGEDVRPLIDPADVEIPETAPEAMPRSSWGAFSVGLAFPTAQTQGGVTVGDAGLELAIGFAERFDLVLSARVGRGRRRGGGGEIYANRKWNVTEDRVGFRIPVATRVRAQSGLGLRHLDLGYSARVESAFGLPEEGDAMAAAEVSTTTVGIWGGFCKTWRPLAWLGIQLDFVDVYLPLVVTRKRAWPKSEAYADKAERALDRQARAVSLTFPRVTLTY